MLRVNEVAGYRCWPGGAVVAVENCESLAIAAAGHIPCEIVGVTDRERGGSTIRWCTLRVHSDAPHRVIGKDFRGPWRCADGCFYQPADDISLRHSPTSLNVVKELSCLSGSIRIALLCQAIASIVGVGCGHRDGRIRLVGLGRCLGGQIPIVVIGVRDRASRK